MAVPTPSAYLWQWLCSTFAVPPGDIFRQSRYCKYIIFASRIGVLRQHFHGFLLAENASNDLSRRRFRKLRYECDDSWKFMLTEPLSSKGLQFLAEIVGGWAG